MFRPAMELPHPLVQGATKIRRHRAARPLAALAAGFVLSATLVFGLVTFVGAAFGIGWLPEGVRVAPAGILVVGMLVVDIISLRAGDVCKLTLRRQTPKALEDRFGPYLGTFMWGIDTGTAVTTIRVSSLTWVTLGLVLLQLAPWWLGLAYGLGFSLSLAASTLLPPWRPVNAFGEPMWVQRLLTRSRPAVQVVCILGLIGFGAVAGAAVIGAL
ncbi:hypothetical protein [Nonomuraea cavernae]|nr:hypothetical protein [Nonomuraea cavernae]MCA2187905.1 hypothetical protein [Nonomuraea cavernae]